MKKSAFNQFAGLAILMLFPLCARAQLVVKENFNGTTLSNPNYTWIALNGTCLTASTSNTTFSLSSPTVGVIPGCVNGAGNGNSYYSSLGSSLVGGAYGGNLPDSSGYGVLRLTNGASSSMSSTNGNNQTGALILANSFPGNAGLNITFNTYTWGGNGFGNSSGAGSGADGIAFFLLDASKYASTGTGANTVYTVKQTGANGGSLGYNCAAAKYSGPGSTGGDGIIGAYLGLGIDEYGNFVNSGDNGNAYDVNSPGALPNTVGIRGAGNVNSTTYPTSSTGLPIGVNPAVGPIVQPQYICQYGYYTTSAISTTLVTTQLKSGSQTLNAVISATANAAAPGATGKATVTWVSAVGNNIYTQTTGTYPVMGVYDYALMKYKNISTSAVGNIYNQQYIKAPQRLATSGSNGTAGSTGANAINYNINLTSTGLLSVSYSYNGGTMTPIISNQNILASNGPIPANFLFGFASGTGGGSNNHEILCFQAIQLTSSASSAGGNIPQNTRVIEGNQIYLASYNPLYWTGTVTATALLVDANGIVTINNSSVWDAGCTLTGTTSCQNTGNTAVTKQPYRAMAAYNDGIAAGGATAPSSSGAVSTSGAGPVAFTVANFKKLSGNQQQMLNCGNPSTSATTCDANGANRVGFLIDGNTAANDAVPANTFRSRYSLLGDMINSSPTWVSAPVSAYANNWVDNLYPSVTPPEGTSYGKIFQPAVAAYNGGRGRLNTVYIGANDGMVHGFSAGYGNVTSATTASDNSGTEVMAFLPGLALSTLHNLISGTGELDFTGLLYAHNLYVDGAPGVGDLYWQGAGNSTGNWQTWLVGGLGGGGNLSGVVGGTVAASTGTVTAATATNGVGEVYAINITNPITPANLGANSGSTVANNVMGDWTTATIVCNTVVGTTGACNSHMGNTYGTPIIRRLHSGNWGIIFGNGLNSASGTAGIFIIEVTGNGSTPTYIIHYIDTGAGASADPTGKGTVNGIAFVSAADLDNDHIADYVYAGDVLGNVWRFDVLSNNASNWGSKTVKIFQTSTSTLLQPITSAVAVSTIPYNNSNGIVVSFGTGRIIPQTLSSVAGYYPTGQNLYGIYDWNMSAWNALGSTQYYVSSAPGGGMTTISNLTQQTLTATTFSPPLAGSGATSGYTNTNNTVCYPFINNCTGSPSTSYGWYIRLPNTQEQIIYNPVIENGIFFINSVIPPNQIKGTTSCTSVSAAGYTYAVDVTTGGSSVSVFGSNAVAIGISGVGTPYFVTTADSSGQNLTTMITQTNSGTAIATQVTLCNGVNCSAGASTRLTWTELR